MGLSENKKSFVLGAALLAGAGLVGKVIGAFYRVVLTSLIGAEMGMAIHNQAYSIYTFLLVLSSAGLPTAISRMVSTRVAKDDRAGAREVVRVARRVLLATGLVASAVMALLAGPIARFMGDASSAPAIMALAPSVFFVCLISSYRGYFQGMQRMTPTAVSQLVEQIGKVAIGFPLAAYLMPRGFVWGAVGAIIGVSLSELAALVLMLGAGANQNRLDRDIPKPPQREKGILRQLFAIAIPITIGAAMMPIVGLVDAWMVMNRLQSAGFTVEQARAMYGPLSGMVKSLIDMPAVITLAMSTALVPAISSALTVRNREGSRTIARTGLKLASLIGMPAAVGMSMLAEPIIRFLYGSQSEEAKLLGTQLLTVMAAGIFFLSIIQTSTGIFQGFGRPALPMITMGAGILIKIAMNYTLIPVPGVHVMGAAYATLTCYVVAAALNTVLIARLSGMKLSYVLSLLRPAVAALGMGAVLWGARYFLADRLSNSMFLFASIAAGGLTYVALIVLTRAVTPQEAAMLPGGRRFAGVFWKGKHRK